MGLPALKIGRLDHVALLSRDPGRGEDFYRDVLGFRAVARPSFSFDGRWLLHDNFGVMLHLIHRDDYQAFDPEGATLNNHLAFSCLEIDAVRAHLTAHHVDFVEKRLPDYGYRQIFFRDPDGNLLEIGEWPEEYLSQLAGSA